MVSVLSEIHGSAWVAFWGWAFKKLHCQTEAVYKVCGTTGLWVTLACAIVGLPASCRGERSYNIQIADVKQSVKNNGKCLLQLVLLFAILPFLVNSVIAFLSYSGPLVNQ